MLENGCDNDARKEKQIYSVSLIALWWLGEERRRDEEHVQVEKTKVWAGR